MSYEIKIALVALIASAAVAAYTDWKSTKIYNWLTLPLALFGLALHAYRAGFSGVTQSLLGLFLCALVPLLMFYFVGKGGGDVKFFGAAGALLLAQAGLEFEFVAFLAMTFFSLGKLAWEGKLLRTLGRTGYLALNPVLPKRLRRSISPELMSMVRMGPAMFVSAIFVAWRYWPM